MSNQSSSTKNTGANRLRFWLMIVPPVAWALFFTPLYVVAAYVGMDAIINVAIIPSIIFLIVVALVCVAAWYGYKQFLVKQ